jgi:hypothetical protein
MIYFAWADRRTAQAKGFQIRDRLAATLTVMEAVTWQ